MKARSTKALYIRALYIKVISNKAIFVGVTPTKGLSLSAMMLSILVLSTGCQTNTSSELDSVFESDCDYTVEGLRPLTFKVDGTVAEVTGEVCDDSLNTFNQMHEHYPKVTTLYLKDVPGSLDDHTNLQLGLRVRQLGMTTWLKANSEVASGGSDLFLAGANRWIEQGARIGVHSWMAVDGDEQFEGSDLPKSHPEHQNYLDFYASLEIPSAFYWYTLEAAPARGMHYMTVEEIEQYNVVTQWIK